MNAKHLNLIRAYCLQILICNRRNINLMMVKELIENPKAAGNRQ